MLSPQQRIDKLVHSKDDSLDFFGWADIFMNEYKMSFEEFKRLKIPVANALAKAMEDRYEKQNKQIKTKKPRRR